jgi:hypothetical protein
LAQKKDKNQFNKSVQSKLDYLTWKMMEEMTPLQRERWLKGVYYERIGVMPDFNNPKSWTEKMCWYRLNYKHPDLQRITDKVSFKTYIEEKLGKGYTAELYASYTCDTQVDISILPDQFVLKSSLSSSANHMMIVDDKSELDIQAVRYSVSQWLQPWNSNARSFGNWYRGMTPQVLAEEYLKPKTGELLDYKLYCFNGIPKHVLVFGGRTTKGFVHLYDLDWNRHPFSGVFEGSEHVIPKPAELEQMLEISRILSAPFPFVRVDLYDVDGRVLVGELTFSSGGGITYLEPRDLEQKWGDLFQLPKM